MFFVGGRVLVGLFCSGYFVLVCNECLHRYFKLRPSLFKNKTRKTHPKLIDQYFMYGISCE